MTTEIRGSFDARQVHQLLQPIHPSRVLRDGKGNSHVSQQDVTAHLIRVLGFGNFDTEVLSVECIFEHNRLDQQGKPTVKWDVSYRALLRLTVRDADGLEVAHYEDGATATAENQKRGDAHDLAYKSAISLSKKRAAISLGDQFGLSLYNKGQMEALVRGTLVRPEVPAETPDEPDDVQEGVPQQVALGNDETEPPPADETPAESAAPATRQQGRTKAEAPAVGAPDPMEAVARAHAAAAQQSADLDTLRNVWKKAKEAGTLNIRVVHPGSEGNATVFVSAYIDERKAELEAMAA